MAEPRPSERRDPGRRAEELAAALTSLAQGLDGGDPLRDEPASVFVPLAAEAPADREATP